jgi:NTE family protein
MKNGKTIGLALSGGAAKGFAHLGVLQAMDELGYSPDYLSGTSAGAIAAAFYADGYTPKEILQILCSYKLMNFIRPGWIKTGLMRTSGFYRILTTHLHTERIEDLKMPTWICMTNLNTGKAEYHNNGSLARKILASCSIPVMFKPVTINNQLMVDGGVCDNLPVAPLIGKAEIIIAVNVNPILYQEIKPGLRSIAERVFQLSVNNHLNNRNFLPDLLIEPEKINGSGYFSLGSAPEYFNIGYESALNSLNHFLQK